MLRNSTAWRDRPVIPEQYEAMAALVATARKARRRLVEFDWFFDREEIVSLRRAIFEWGKNVTGRYKCFDARVLSEINKALGDSDTPLVLSAPKNSWFEGEVRCEAVNDGFRLYGHTTFDLIFGYGLPGADETAVGAVHLMPSVRRILATSVESLGWDLRQLTGSRYRPVRNVLFGMSPGEPDPTEIVEHGAVTDVPLHFHGPFTAQVTAGCRGLFSEPLGARRGVYLWTINVAGVEQPWYIGQTCVAFRTRMAQHIAAVLSGEYAPYDIDALKRGEYKIAEPLNMDPWPKRLSSIIENYERLVPHLIGQIRLTKFHLAELPNDPDLLNRVEGALGRYFKSHERTRNFFTPGLRVPGAIPYDKPLRLVISAECSIGGLPSGLLL